MKIAKNNAKNCVPSMPRPELLQLSERIKLVIEILKVEKKLFAQAGGITAQSLSGYLAAIREPGATCLEGWIRSFNINGHWLLTGEGNMLLSQDQPEISSIPKEEFDEHLSQAQREMLTFRRIMAELGTPNEEIAKGVMAIAMGKTRDPKRYSTAEPPADPGYNIIHEPEADFSEKGKE